jgi:hypothetical protein
MPARLTLAVALALSGPVVVLVALELAGGSNRPRPQYLLFPRGSQVPGTCTPFCEGSAELKWEYRVAWIGFALGLIGALLLLAIVGRRSLPRSTAYGSLAAVSGVAVVAAAWLALKSIEFCFGSLGCSPRPWDAFELVAVALLAQGVALVPVGALARRLRE